MLQSMLMLLLHGQIMRGHTSSKDQSIGSTRLTRLLPQVIQRTLKLIFQEYPITWTRHLFGEEMEKYISSKGVSIGNLIQKKKPPVNEADYPRKISNWDLPNNIDA